MTLLRALALSHHHDAAIAMTEGDLPKALRNLGLTLALLEREETIARQDPGLRRPTPEAVGQTAHGNDWDDVPF